MGELSQSRCAIEDSGIEDSAIEDSAIEDSAIEDLDAAGVLEAAGRNVFERRAAQVADLRLLSHWAALHASDPRDDPSALPQDLLVQVGGDGTPWVRDLCLVELAVVRQVHELSTRAALADVLDLQHRLPRVWGLVERLQAEPWVARRAASMSRAVPLEHMGVVDAGVARVICGEAPSRVLQVIAAKVVEADPLGHARRVEEQARRRFVGTGRVDEHGLRHLIARVTAGDAVALEAMVDRVARVLADQHAVTAASAVAAGQEPPRVPTMDELRSDALGILARPAEALAMLLGHAVGPQDGERRPAESEDGAEDGAEDPLRSSRTTAFPDDLLDVLRECDPASLRPPVTLYAHVAAAGLWDPERAVVRVEGIGPVLLSQLQRLLGETTVTLKPVIDLERAVTGTAYEHPASVKERMWLLTGRDTFPYSAHTGRDVDYDHVQPFRADGGEGQTGTHNCQPLSRRSHRHKTLAGFSTTQLEPGRYLWRTPHGHYLMVGPDGTYPVSPEHGRRLVS